MRLQSEHYVLLSHNKIGSESLKQVIISLWMKEPECCQHDSFESISNGFSDDDEDSRLFHLGLSSCSLLDKCRFQLCH